MLGCWLAQCLIALGSLGARGGVCAGDFNMTIDDVGMEHSHAKLTSAKENITEALSWA